MTRFPKGLVLAPALLVLLASTALSQNTTLPTYRLTIDPDLLAGIDTESNVYLPAQLQIDTANYDVGIHVRGSSSRWLPVLSWKIRFENDNNLIGDGTLLLNAEYRDAAEVRNHIAYRLYEEMGIPAPKTKHVSFFINGEYKGVFTQTEEIDSSFLKDRNMAPADMYKSNFPDGRMSPLPQFGALLYEPDMNYSWNKEWGNTLDHSDLQAIQAKIHYWSASEFKSKISQLVDVDKVLTFFAVRYGIAGVDGATKDHVLYINPNNNRLEILPWDNDATFGLDGSGMYYDFLADFEGITGQWRHNTLFSRLMEDPARETRFWQIMQDVINRGFSKALDLARQSHAAITADMHLDPNKKTTNQEFDDALAEIEEFIPRRKAWLSNFMFQTRYSIDQFTVDNPFPTAANPDVTFTVKTSTPQPMKLRITPDADLAAPGSNYTQVSVEMFDDGAHGDGAAGDGTYGATYTVPSDAQDLVHFAFQGSNGHLYPPYGIEGITRFVNNTYALKTNQTLSQMQQLAIGRLYLIGDETYLEITNGSNAEIDLSYCHIRAGSTERTILIPNGIKLPAGGTMIAASDANLAGSYFPDADVFLNNMFFPITNGQNVQLLSPALTPIVSKSVSTSSPPAEAPGVVINEINYNSSNVLESGDWIELHNTSSQTVDLSGWRISDSKPFRNSGISAGAMIEAGDYLVIVNDESRFSAAYPGVTYATGFDFGLSDGGDFIRIASPDGSRVDVVPFSRYDPWPKDADGTGATLELKKATDDNGVASNWEASRRPAGTPGAANLATTSAGGASPKLVISEINYHAPDDNDAGDWIEFYNPSGSSIDVGNYFFRDSQSENFYLFPEGTMVAANGYLIMGDDLGLFSSVHPNVSSPVIGPFPFNLSNAGEELSLFDQDGRLLDTVTYDDMGDWPTQPDGLGSSLVLINLNADNSRAENWAPSLEPGGSPGQENRVLNSELLPSTLSNGLQANYPNPFAGTTTISYSVEVSSEVRIEAFDLLGRRVETLFEGRSLPGVHELEWTARDASSGVYVIVLNVNGKWAAQQTTVKMNQGYQR